MANYRDKIDEYWKTKSGESWKQFKENKKIYVQLNRDSNVWIYHNGEVEKVADNWVQSLFEDYNDDMNEKENNDKDEEKKCKIWR